MSNPQHDMAAWDRTLTITARVATENLLHAGGQCSELRRARHAARCFIVAALEANPKQSIYDVMKAAQRYLVAEGFFSLN